MAHQPVLSPERERRLIERTRRGDRGALGELLTAYHKRVYHVCLRMVSNEDDAAELTQDVLLRAVQHIDGFKGDARFSTWLLRIAMNQSVSHLRRRRVRATVSLDHIHNGDDQAAPLKAFIASDREPLAEQSVEIEEQVERLTRALKSLDVSLRSVIVLRDLQDMDYQGMAETLSLPVGTIKSRLFRARLALRQAMAPGPPIATEASHD